MCAGLVFGQATPEKPAGLVLVPGGSQLLRAGTQLPIAAKAGDVVFAGDALRGGTGAMTLLHCGQPANLILAPGADVVIEAKDVRLRSGTVSGRNPAGSCLLPPMIRVAAASQQHFGASMVRPLVLLAGTRQERIQALPPDQRAQLQAELSRLTGDDPLALVERAGLFEGAGLKADAATEYRAALKHWPDAIWILGRLFALEDTPPVERQPVESKGKTYALIAGISSYQSERVPGLLYAADDALLMADFLRKERGGGLTDDQLLVLTDRKATTAAIRLAFEEFLKRKTGKDDTAIFFVAAHGTVRPSDGQAFIVTHDTDPEDLAATALPLADIQKLFRQELQTTRRVMIFMDACHAGKLGEVAIKSINDSVEQLSEGKGEAFSFLAAGKDEKAEEGPQYGGGHGAFTYFVVDGWNGASDRNQDGKVEFPEFVRYVRRMVEDATEGRQNPKERGDLGRVVLAETGRPGIQLARYQPGVQQIASVRPPTRSLALPPVLAAYEEALDRGNLLPDSPGSAFAMLPRLRAELSPDAFLTEENRLRAALEAAGQQVLLRYLAGEEKPQQRTDFERGAAYFAAAQRLTPESLLLDARKVFCQARAQIFGKDYARAADLLERAVRLDPPGAYSYNALGIAYLEQANYPLAVAAFQDSSRLAPYWTYPLHNLALTYTQMGQYRRAIDTYRQAMRLAPGYAYLPYNLGLVYQRLNRPRDAERLYQKASSLRPDAPEPLNAMGTLRAASGKRDEAERLYRQSLQKNALLSARHNLAVLLASQPGRAAEAIDLWRQNLRQSADHLPSRLSLAHALQSSGRLDESAAEYRALLKQQPAYVAGYLALAEVLVKAKQPAAALAELRTALRLQPDSVAAWERTGDLLAETGSRAEAREAFEKAQRLAIDGAARKRLRRKIGEASTR